MNQTKAVLSLILALASFAAAQSTTPEHYATLTVSQKFSVTIAPKTANGDAATLDSAATISCAAASGIVSAAPIFGGWQITALAVGTTRCKITAFSAGNDVSEFVNVTVTADPAVTLGLVASTPVQK